MVGSTREGQSLAYLEIVKGDVKNQPTVVSAEITDGPKGGAAGAYLQSSANTITVDIGGERLTVTLKHAPEGEDPAKHVRAVKGLIKEAWRGRKPRWPKLHDRDPKIDLATAKAA